MGHRRFGQAASLLLSLSIPVWALLPAAADAQIGIGVSITVAPPLLPVYAQPAIPGPDYLWTPGYWGWADGDYYWVPGTWVEAPQPGYLWTPGYWGWANGAYLWNGGYWGEHIGFYGGVNYGYGYGGTGYQGGYWQQGHFFYNQSVNNIRGNTQITHVYSKTVINNVTNTRVSFNGGSGGIVAQPSASERAAASEAHLPPVQAQVQHEQVAHATPALRATVNHGQPPIAATARPGALSGPGVVPAASAAPRAHPVQASAARAPAQAHATAAHPGAPSGQDVAPATPVAPGAHPLQASAARPPARPHAATPKPAPAHPPAEHAAPTGERDR